MKPSTIIGHARQRRSLERLARKRAVPSALMLAGISGTGKKLVGRELVRTILCERFNPVGSGDEPISYGGCGACEACRLFDGGNHADFHQIDFGDKDAGRVESVRELLCDLSLNSFAGRARVAFIDNAEQMSLQAANILLKSLEEPRPNSYFILVCSSPSRLPATLLSRCQIFFFDALSSAEVKEILSAHPETNTTFNGVSIESLAQLADGSFDGLAQISAHVGQWNALQARLTQVASGNFDELVSLATSLAKDKESLPVMLQFLRIFARQKLLGSHSDPHTRQAEQHRWAILLHNILSVEHLVFERNLSASYVLSVALGELAQGANQRTFTPLTHSVTILNRVAV